MAVCWVILRGQQIYTVIQAATLTTLHCSKVSFLQCCHMKRYNKIFTKMWGVYSLLWDTEYMYVCMYLCMYPQHLGRTRSDLTAQHGAPRLAPAQPINKTTLRGFLLKSSCRVILHPVTVCMYVSTTAIDLTFVTLKINCTYIHRIKDEGFEGALNKNLKTWQMINR